MNFEDALQLVKTQPLKPCYLCGGVGAINGIFIPTVVEVTKQMGAPTGKHRAVIYSLCDSCFHIPQVQEEIEWKLLQSTIG
jgi:hypothetical protein